MSTIRQTALAAVGGRVPRGLGSQAQAALAAVEAREKEMFEDIVEDGVSLGATRDQVYSILVSAGMTPPDEPASGDTDRVSTLEGQVRDLLIFARSKGYTG